MKKSAAWLGVFLALLLVCAAASAASFTLDEIHATVTLGDGLTGLTPDNLSEHSAWVIQQGQVADVLAQQWRDEGILLVGVGSDPDTRLVITAVQDDDAKQYFDLDQQTTKTRTAYRNKFNKTTFKSEGYVYTKSEWTKSSRYGRMLILQYSYTGAGERHRGYAYRTIRNGYTITVDWQVTGGRTLKNKDIKAVETVMKTFSFTRVLEKPMAAVSRIVYTETPPAETNTGRFTISGTSDPGVYFYGVATRMSSGDVVKLSGTANAKGRFSIDVTLPTRGYWLITMSAQNGTEEVDEVAFDVINYDPALIPITFKTDFTAPVTTDEMTISGVTLKSTTVQCIVEKANFQKTVTTNGTGRFTFKVPMKAEGDYEIVLSFQRKGNFNNRRFTYTVSRQITENSRRAAIRKEAVKPAYSTLTKKLTGYTGRIMGYNLYFIDAQQAGDEWVLTMAMTSSKNGYKNLVYIIAGEDPGFDLGSQHKMYGTCTGSYSVTDGDSTVTYPCFELLFWDE